jgi:hypothetical protein
MKPMSAITFVGAYGAATGACEAVADLAVTDFDERVGSVGGK